MPRPVGRVILENTRHRNLNNFVFPEDIGAHRIMFTFSQYDYKDIRNGRPQLTSRLSETVMLPLPQNLDDNLSVRVQRYDQGALGDAIAQGTNAIAGAPSAGAIYDEVQKVVGQFLPNPQDATNIARALFGGDIGDTSSRISFLARNTIDELGAGRNIDAGLGSTINPKAALYFEGVEMKRHSFTWTFMPRSQGESDELRDITNLIRKNSLPTYIHLTTSGGTNSSGIQRAMFRYPSICNIYLLGLDETHYMTFKPCMISEININLAPQGHAILKGGKPAAVTMTIQMIETDIWTASDYGAASQTREDVSENSSGE